MRRRKLADTLMKKKRGKYSRVEIEREKERDTVWQRRDSRGEGEGDTVQ